jgi:ABC-2 type transport system permease protein
MVLADGGIIKNKARVRNGQVQMQPLGYDQYSKQTFETRRFSGQVVSGIFSDDSGNYAIKLKFASVKTQVLDKVKSRDQKIKWQLINTAWPLAFFLILALFFSATKKKYVNFKNKTNMKNNNTR